MDMMANILVDIWGQWVWPILLLVVGLGLVIFVHELGHFLVAKAVRIKVQRFSLGFGWRVFGIKIGETEYSIGALPLGGYVKMLGQEDFSRLEETGAQPDPGSYAAKSVGARMAVISAGVVMNIIFAAILFVVICLIGKKYISGVVGGAVPGFPASQAEIAWQKPPGVTTPPPADKTALKPGDKIVSIEGDRWVLNLVGMPVTRFGDIRMISLLADKDDEFLFTIERQVDGRTWIGTARLGVEWMRSDTLGFGIAPAYTTTIDTLQDEIAQTPFQQGDKVVAVNGQEILNSWDIGAACATLDGAPVKVTVQRRDGDKTVTEEITVKAILGDSQRVFWLKDGRRIRGKIVAQRWDKKDRVTYYDLRAEDGAETTICQETDRSYPLLDILGMIPRLRVVTVAKGSRAHKSGLKPGDIIASYGNNHQPTFDEFRGITKEAVDQETDISVLRAGQDHPLPLKITPTLVNDRALVGVALAPEMAHCVVAQVRKGSAADKAGIVAEAAITAVNETPVKSWLDLYRALRAEQGKSVSIAFRLGSREDTAQIPKLTPELFDPADYQLSIFGPDVPFDWLTVRIVKTNPLAAIKWGCKETVKSVLGTYLALRSMARRTVPVGSAAGPVGIGSVAIKAARQGVLDFVYFIAFLSAVIAVFNFLPLPILDGGHAVLLIIEKIRRKPLSVRMLNIIQTVGLVLILSIFVAVTFNDIIKIIRGSW